MLLNALRFLLPSVGINLMKTKIYILVIFTIAFIGCKDTTKSTNESEVGINVADTILIEPKNSIDSNKVEHTDKVNTKKAINQVETTKELTVDWTGTHEIKLVLNEFRITDSLFYSLLDSLVKREKRCMNSTLSALHWTLFEWQEKVYHLTMSSDVGEAEYLGFFFIDNMLFLTAENLPEQFEQTGKSREFTFQDKNFPYPEDYSSYFIANMNGQMKLVKSYAFPCD